MAWRNRGSLLWPFLGKILLLLNKQGWDWSNKWGHRSVEGARYDRLGDAVDCQVIPAGPTPQLVPGLWKGLGPGDIMSHTQLLPKIPKWWVRVGNLTSGQRAWGNVLWARHMFDPEIKHRKYAQPSAYSSSSHSHGLPMNKRGII